jgi:hypothetical protein
MTLRLLILKKMYVVRVQKALENKRLRRSNRVVRGVHGRFLLIAKITVK